MSRSQMGLVPRISLQAVFLLFLCAAVGLATYSDPLAALEPAIASAMVIGLVQQVRQLITWHPHSIEASKEIAFARWFAIIWRLLLTAFISACVLVGMFVSRGLLQLPEHDELWFHWEYQALLPICLIIVLCNSMARWQSALPSQANRHGSAAVLWTVGIVIGFVTIIDATTTQFLVHKAVAGIEAAAPAEFRRPDVYPDLSNELYRPLWLASAAVVSILVAGAIIIWSSKRGNSRATLLAKYSVFALLVIPPVCFARWYYTAEFHRLSPEIADVGLAAIWTDWLIGALLVLTLATIGAYHIGRMGNKAAEITPDISHNLERTAFHESFLCLAIIGIKGIAMVGLYIASAISAYSMFGRSPPVWSYATLMLSNPPSLLALALMIATFQIIWARWRSRTGKVAWKLRGLSRSAFLRNAAALTILLIVAIPTLNAFAFILWLGPWNLLRLFGY